jgi:hypothetical protein
MALKPTEAVKLILAAILVLCMDPASACTLNEYDIIQPLLTPDVPDANKCHKVVSTPKLIGAMRVVDKYWSRRIKNEERYGLLSNKYRNILGGSYGIKQPGQYVIPLSEPERVWQGYKINSLNIVSSGSIEFSIQVQWSQEGRRGTMTFLFVLVEEKDRWAITDIHF